MKQPQKCLHRASRQALKWTIISPYTAGSLSYSLRNESFDVVVIDEAAQALEAACWGAMLKGKGWLPLSSGPRVVGTTVQSKHG